MDNALVTIQDMQMGARAIAASGLFGLKTPDQALALMLIAQAEGYPAALAARDYHVFNGRPSLKADAMLARFQQAGGKVEWADYTDTKVSATFTHPQGGTIKIDWTADRAKTAGLSGKDNWRNYPRQMLRARVISEGIRTVYPSCCCGTYTPEEVADMEPVQTPPRETTATVIDTAPPAAPAAPPADTQPVPPAAPATATTGAQQPAQSSPPANGVIVEGIPRSCKTRDGKSAKTGKPWTAYNWTIECFDNSEMVVSTYSESDNSALKYAAETSAIMVIRCTENRGYLRVESLEPKASPVEMAVGAGNKDLPF